MTPLLTNKNIIVYGAGGGIGRGVAATFAREGASVYRIEPLEALLASLEAAGHSAEIAVVDARNEQAVAEHASGEG